MKKLKPEILKKFKEAIKKPVGTISIKYTFDHDLFDIKNPGEIIFEIISGVNYVHLERENSPKVSFYHSAPGIGTRVSTVDLKMIKPSKKIHFIFSWATDEIKLHVGSIIEGGNFITAIGTKSKKSFQVDKNGNVIQVGDKGIQVMGVRISSNGIQLLKPTAIEIWKSTKQAIEILQTGKSDEGFMFEVIKSNFTLVMLVTGFESYCKTRFQEMELEGVIIDVEELREKNLSKKEILKPTTNYFQNFDTAKSIFKIGVGIKFGNIFPSHKIQNIKKKFSFRHRIIHVDPLLTMLNELNTPAEKPMFSTNIAKTAVTEFNNFIENLHTKTLELMHENG